MRRLQLISVLVSLSALLFGPSNSIAQQATKMSYQGVEVELFNASWTNGSAQLTFRVKNITNEEGNPHEIAIAEAPYTAKLMMGGAGRNFSSVRDGLPDGKKPENWIRLVPGGSVAVTYNFSLCCDMFVFDDGSYAGPQPPFHFNTQIKVYKFNGQPLLMPVYIGPIGKAARPFTPYPSPR